MSGKKPMTGVNVDEVVALGAAIMAAKVLGERSVATTFALGAARRTRDVMSHSLGAIAESQDGTRYVNSIILPKGRPLPDKATRTYELVTPPDRAAEWEVYLTQGESDQPRACTLLGKYVFRDVTPVRGGPAQLDITYRYDENGVVGVSATERSTGKTLPMTQEAVPEDMNWLDKAPVRRVEHTPLTAYLALDLLRSMEGKPLAEAKKAALEFVRQCNLEHTSVGVITFAERMRTDLMATRDAAALRTAIGALRVRSLGDGTFASPIALAMKHLEHVEGLRFIVLLTDGEWEYPGNVVKEAKTAQHKDIEIVAIGFGNAKQDFLRAIATSDSNSFLVRAGELVETFGSIARELAQTASSGKRGLRMN